MLQFELDYPNEMITYVEGTFKSFASGKIRVTSLIFKSSEGRTSQTFGNVSGTKFVLEKKGCAVVGFHGRHDDRDLVAIGAYYSQIPPPTAEKLRPQGGCRGGSWDDGVYDNVRKIYVGQCENGIAFLKFVYDKDTRMVIGDDHGNKTPLEIKEVINYYFTALLFLLVKGLLCLRVTLICFSGSLMLTIQVNTLRPWKVVTTV